MNTQDCSEPCGVCTATLIEKDVVIQEFTHMPCCTYVICYECINKCKFKCPQCRQVHNKRDILEATLNVGLSLAPEVDWAPERLEEEDEEFKAALEQSLSCSAPFKSVKIALKSLEWDEAVLTALCSAEDDQMAAAIEESLLFASDPCFAEESPVKNPKASKAPASKGEPAGAPAGAPAKNPKAPSKTPAKAPVKPTKAPAAKVTKGALKKKQTDRDRPQFKIIQVRPDNIVQHKKKRQVVTQAQQSFNTPFVFSFNAAKALLHAKKNQ